MDNRSSQILEFAVDMETALHNFYFAASQGSRFQRIKDMFMSMADKKVANKKLLDSISTVKVGPGFDTENFALFRDLEITSGMSYREISNTCLKLEERAFIFYRDLAEFDQEEKVKATLSSLAQESKQHIKIFQDQTFGK